MARAPRLVIPGNPVHVIQRGNNRTATFGSHDDFARYSEILHEAIRRSACTIHAYVFMTNHVHLLVTPADDRGLSSLMQMLGRRYVRYINARYDRTGTLWEGRFRSSLIDSERYFLACSRYIELNPVRAGMVASPSAYRWSSHGHNVHGDSDELITPHAVYHTLGANSAAQREAYQALFQAPLPAAIVNAIRHATNSGGVLSDADFRERLETQFGRAVDRHLHGGDRRSASFRSSRL